MTTPPLPKARFYFYIMRCGDGTLYCGSTKDIKNRERLHNSGRGSIYVRTHGGGKIIYTETLASWGVALRREAEVKKWPRQKKTALAAGKRKR